MISTGVKPEGRGKLTINGFFGLSPEVYVEIDFPPGVLELSFLMQGGAGDGGDYGISFRIVDDMGNTLHTQAKESRPAPEPYFPPYTKRYLVSR
jgi:hypothetical protein